MQEYLEDKQNAMAALLGNLGVLFFGAKGLSFNTGV